MSSNQEYDVSKMLADLFENGSINNDELFCRLTLKFHNGEDASEELAILFANRCIDPQTFCQLTRGFRARKDEPDPAGGTKALEATLACVPCTEQTADGPKAGGPKAGGSVESSVAKSDETPPEKKKAKDRRVQFDLPYDATDAECEVDEDNWCTVAAKTRPKSKADGQKAGGQNAGGQKAGGQKDTSKEQNNPSYKTDLCFFAKSGCNNPDCQFAHSLEEVRPHPKLIAAQKHPLYRTEMCMNGENCKIWWYCQFAHDPDELRERVYPDT